MIGGSLTKSVLGVPLEVALVLAVARLGEAGLFGWWVCRGLSEAGAYVLGRGLPRTWQLAALEGDVLSAAARHQEILARPDAIHLFSDELGAKRLALNWLRERKVDGGTDGFLADLRSWTTETGRDRLAAWAGMAPPIGEELGAVRRLGVISREVLARDDGRNAAVRQLAAAYALGATPLRVPYLDLQR